MPEEEYKLTLDEFRSRFGDASGYVEYVGRRAYALLVRKY